MTTAPPVSPAAPLTPTTPKPRHAEGMLLNFDSWLGSLPPDQQRGVSFHLKASGQYADREKKRLASMYAVAEDTGLDLGTVNERWNDVRGGYAETLGGDWNNVKDDDDGFHAQLVKHVQKRRDERGLLFGPDADTGTDDDATAAARLNSLASLVASSAMRGEPYTAGWSAWQNAARGKAGFDVARFPDYEESARKIHNEVSRRMEEVKPAVDEMLAGLTRERDGTAGAYGGKELVDAMEKLTPQQRPMAQALLATRAAAIGAEKAEGGQLMQAIGRGSSGLLVGTARTFEASTLDAAEKRLAEIKPGDEIGGRFPSLYAYARDKSASGAEVQALKFLAEPVLKNTVATAESIAEAKAQLARDRDRLQINMQLEQVGKGVLDPLKGGNVLTNKILYPFAESVAPQIGLALLTRRIAPVGSGFTGALASSAGAAVPMWGMMADQNAQQLIAQSPELGLAKAYQIGKKAAYAQTGLEYLGLMAGLGTLPKLGATLKAMRGTTFLKTLAASAAAQNAIEGAQDLLSPIAQALSSDVPGVKWDEVFNGTRAEIATRTEGTGADARTIYTAAGKDFTNAGEAQAHADKNKVGGYWAERVDTALALLPVVIFGTGGKVMQARAGKVNLEQAAAGMTDANLHAAGIPAETRAAILAEPDAVKRLDAFDTARQSADKATAEEGARRMDAEQQAREVALSSAMESAGITFETDTNAGTPIYRITREGVTTEHATAADALAAAADQMNAADRQQNGPLFEMIDALTNNPLSPVKETTVSLEPGQTVAEYQARRAAILSDPNAAEGDRTRAEAESAAMEERMRVFEAADTDGPIDWRAVDVGGQSELQVKAGVARAVLRVANGESPRTILEEKSEAELAAWIQSGETTPAGMAGMIQQIEAATKNTYLNGYTGGENPAQDMTAIREAYSELVQVHATGQGRAGKPARGAVAEILQAERRNLYQNLRQAMAAGAVQEGLAARLQAAAKWLQAVVSKAVRLHRARRKAGGAFDLDRYLNASIGIEAEAQQAADVVTEAQRIFPEATAQGTPNTQEEEPIDPGFRLTSFSALDRLAETLERRARDPEARRKIYDQMQATLEAFRPSWQKTRDALTNAARDFTEKRTKKELNKEQAFREAAAAADAEGAIYDNLSMEAQAALSLTGEDANAFKGPLAQLLSGGRFGTRGRIMAKAEAIRIADAADFKLGGEYDGAEGVPAWFFGGSLPVDTAAQEAADAGLIAEASPDLLFEAIRSELQTQSKNKEAMKAALDALKAAHRTARADAKAQAAAWRKEQDEQQAEDWNGRAVMLRNMRILEALLSAMPPEVRGRVGGWANLASLKTPQALANEIDRRLSVADKHLETALKKDAMESIRALIDKAAPKREGGKKPKGKLGYEAHRFFDEVERVLDLTPDQVREESILLEAGYSREDITQDTAAGLFEKQQILDMFGALGKPKAHTAAHLTRALDQLEHVYATGRNRWRVLEEMRLEEVAGFQNLTIAAVGGINTQSLLEMKDASNTALGMLKLGTISLRSFTETMEILLGRGNVLAARWSRAAREGMAQRTDEVFAAGRDWTKALQQATGKKERAARRAAWDMGSVRNVAVTKAPTGFNESRVPVDVIDAWTAGTANPASLDVTKAEAAELQAARAAMLADNQKVEAAGKGRPDTRQFLTLARPVNGPVESVKHTEAEGVYLSMLWAQEAYKPALRKAGYGEDAQAEIEAGLSDAAKFLRSWLGTRYADGYEPLAKQFRLMFGVDLPRIENYAPGLFYNQGTGDTNLDIGGSAQVEGGFRGGFMKDRTAHTAAPRPENAFQVFFGHLNQTAHWKALAPLTRELRGVFGNPEVKQAILSKHGPQVLEAVNKWIESIEGNGLKVAHSRMGNWIYGMQAHVALSWKLGTVLKQSTALLGAAYRMPAADYLRGLALLTAGAAVKAGTLGKRQTAFWQTARKVHDSPLIQRRLAGGFTPEVRAALAGVFTAKPTMRGDFLTRGMEVLGFVDAFFTSGSAAIAYDYHLRQAKAAGMTDAEAEAAAKNETDDVVSRTAQPVEVTDRSLFEQSLGGLGKGIFVFSSEARQKSSLWLSAWGNTFTGKATAEDFRVLAIAHLVVGPVIQAITAAMRDRLDDDDEWTDELGPLGFLDMEQWNPLDFLIAAGTGPISGIPLIRDLVDGYRGESGPLSRVGNGILAAGSLMDGAPESEKEHVEWYVRKITAVIQGLPLPDASAAVAAGIGSDLFRTVDNLSDSPAEAQAKETRTLEKKAKEKKDDTEKARRAALTPQARKAEDDQKAADRATNAARKLDRLRRENG